MAARASRCLSTSCRLAAAGRAVPWRRELPQLRERPCQSERPTFSSSRQAKAIATDDAAHTSHLEHPDRLGGEPCFTGPECRSVRSSIAWKAGTPWRVPRGLPVGHAGPRRDGAPARTAGTVKPGRHLRGVARGCASFSTPAFPSGWVASSPGMKSSPPSAFERARAPGAPCSDPSGGLERDGDRNGASRRRLRAPGVETGRNRVACGEAAPPPHDAIASCRLTRPGRTHLREPRGVPLPAADGRGG